MADGRICDGIGFAQIKPVCAAPACRTEGTIPVPNGGTARGYQEFLAPSAISAAASRRVARPYIYAAVILGANARICRVPSADWRPGRVYFLTLLEPLAGTTGLWPLPPGRPLSATVGELNPTVDWFTAHAADRVFLDCHGADIRVRRACRTRPVAPHGKADRGSRRRGERGAPAGTSDAAGTRGRLLDGRLPTGCLETGGDPGQAEGCQPRQHPASRASAGGQAPGTSRRSPPVRSRSPGRSKMRLPSMSAPATPSR
jgi:hypothetical protein